MTKVMVPPPTIEVLFTLNAVIAPIVEPEAVIVAVPVSDSVPEPVSVPPAIAPDVAVIKAVATTDGAALDVMGAVVYGFPFQVNDNV